VTSPREIAAKESRAILRRAIRLALDTESAAVRRKHAEFQPQSLSCHSRTARLRCAERRSAPHQGACAGQSQGAHSAAFGECYAERRPFLFCARCSGGAPVHSGCLQAHRVRSLVKGKSMNLGRDSPERRAAARRNPRGGNGFGGVHSAGGRRAAVAHHRSRHPLLAGTHHRTLSQEISNRFAAGYRREFDAIRRERLRKDFLAADAGITGANLVSADCGSLLLVESEANIR